MARPEVVIVRTGTANLASMVAGLERAGATPRISDFIDDIVHADRVVLPGVGTLGAAMAALGDGRDRAVAERVAAGKQTLAVCLGLQLLCDGSEESPTIPGLGLVPGYVTRFSGSVRTPQLGWNTIEVNPGCSLLQSGWAFFANSYRLQQPPPGFFVAMSDHGGPFVAAIERGPVLACQFHPELSGQFGIDLLKRWIFLEHRGA